MSQLKIRSVNAWSFTLLLLALFGFFVWTHYVMAYSDPNQWLLRAVRLGEGDPLLRRVLLFPGYLLLALKVLGPDWVFLANLPFALLLAGTCGLLARRSLLEDAVDLHRSSMWIAFGTFVAGAMLVLPFNGHGGTDRVIRLLNPYRDMGAMAMAMTGLYVYILSEAEAKWKSSFTAGLLFGCSMSFRETTPLAVVGVMALFAGSWFREMKTWRRNRWAVSLLIGGILGITPLLIQNYLYSGYALVPAYSAVLMIQEEGRTGADAMDPRNKPRQKEQRLEVENPELDLKADELIPAVDFALLFHNLPSASKLIVLNLGWQGLGLIGLGLIAAVLHRNRIILSVLFPGMIATFLFFACYKSVMWRYMFGVMALSFPVMGYGAAHGLGWLGKALRGRGFVKKHLHLLRPLPLCLAWLFWISFCVSYAIKQPQQMQVWDVADFRESVQPKLKSPRTFLGFYHHRELLSWLVDHDHNRSELGSIVDQVILREQGLEAALTNLSRYFFDEYSDQHFYAYGSHDLPRLSALWLDHSKVLSFKNLPVKAARYRKELDGWLYELHPWQHQEIREEIRLSPEPGEPVVMMINAYRLWDYPNRTYATLAVNDLPILDRIENGPQFVEIPGAIQGESLDLHIGSDAPLPKEPLIEIWPLNQEWRIPMGFQRDAWYHSFWSEDLKYLSPLREGVTYLWDEGKVRIPSFADSSRKLFLDVHLEFFQEDPLFRNQPHWIEINGHRFELPPRRTSMNAVVPFGWGTGELEEHVVTFRTSLPSYEEQRHMAANQRITSWSCVKLFSLKILPVEWIPDETFHFDMRMPHSAAYLLEGAHKLENHLGQYSVRWTNGECRMLIPLASVGRERVLTLSYFAMQHAEEAPELIWNGKPLQRLSDVEPKKDKKIRVHYRLPAGSVQSGLSEQVLLIRSQPWKPSDVMGTTDTRTLGVMFYRLEIE